MLGRDDHLHELATALVDGSLGHAARERALVHLTRCSPCRTEVDAQRRLKSTIAGLPDPQASLDLGSRLLDIGRIPTGCGAVSSPAGAVPPPWTAAAFAGPTLGGSRLGDARFGGAALAAHGRATRRIVGGAALLAVATGAAIAMHPRENAVSVSPSVATFTVEHAATADELPGADPAEGAAVVVVSSHR